MTFRDILFIYNNKIDNARRRLARGLIDEHDYDIMIEDSLYWLAHLKDFMEFEEWCKVRKPTEEEIKKYGELLVEIMEYRDDIIPIYNDDYGQSLHAVICGKDYGGGTYNFFPYVDFAFIYDREILTYYK